MAHVLGLDAKLYRNTGTYGSPTWDEITNVRDLTLSLEKATTDVTTRAASGWRQYAATLKDATVDFSMVWDNADTDFTAVKDAFVNNTSLDVWVLDGSSSTSGSQGLRAVVDVVSFSRNEGIEDALTVDVSLKPRFDSNAPAWNTVP